VTGKPVKRSVSVAVMRSMQPPLLIVRRPADDQDLPNAWGLPAASLLPGESWADAVRRAGREKLGVELRVGEELGQGTADRETYSLEMKLFAAEIDRGAPAVPQAVPGVTQYQAWKWGERELLEPAAARGSLCCRLFLDYGPVNRSAPQHK